MKISADDFIFCINRFVSHYSHTINSGTRYVISNEAERRVRFNLTKCNNCCCYPSRCNCRRCCCRRCRCRCCLLLFIVHCILLLLACRCCC